MTNAFLPSPLLSTPWPITVRTRASLRRPISPQSRAHLRGPIAAAISALLLLPTPVSALNNLPPSSTVSTTPAARSITKLARSSRPLTDAPLGPLVIMPHAPPAIRPTLNVVTLEEEREMLTRLLCAVMCGAVIGLERRAASATAGLRTFALVSLGSCIFTLVGVFGLSDPGAPARVGAAVASGVGFLGAGAINRGGHGSRNLTTSASIWISASTGVASACGLFRLAFVGAIVTVFVLRWSTLIRYARLVGRRKGRLVLAFTRRKLLRQKYRRGPRREIRIPPHSVD